MQEIKIVHSLPVVGLCAHFVVIDVLCQRSSSRSYIKPYQAKLALHTECVLLDFQFVTSLYI